MRLSSVHLLSAVWFGVAALSSCSDSGPLPPSPLPILTSFTPSEAVAGASQVILTAVGDSFVPRSRVQWNGIDLPTHYVDGQHLTATVGRDQLTQSGFWPITVFNPAPGGGVSEAGDFAVWSNQPPQITQLTPDTGVAGALPHFIHVIGSNFDQRSVVSYQGQYRATQFESSNYLTIALAYQDVVDPGNKAIQVKNAAGLTSNIVQYVLISPVPVIVSVAATQNGSGGQSVDLHIFGQGFLRSSVVQLNGSPLTTTLVTTPVPGTELVATLPASAISSPGTYNITVANPPSPGGISNAFSFDIVSGAPTITGLNSYGATAGGTAYTISVRGTGFSPFSVVNWNGAAKTTTFRSDHRLDARVDASDIASPGTASITVTRLGSNTGTSNSRNVVVRPTPPPTVTSILAVDVAANSIVYDKSSNRFYASVSDSAPTNVGSVVAIDPASGAIVGAVKLGNPRLMALSPEGGVLWVHLADSARIVRIDVPSLTTSTLAQVGNVARINEMKVRPGQPGAIAVEKTIFDPSMTQPRTVMFVDGNQLPSSPPASHPNTTFAFDETGSFLYGFNGLTSAMGFHTLEVRPDGLAEVNSSNLIYGETTMRFDYASGRAYSTTGLVIDAEDHKVIGTFPVVPIGYEKAVYADAELGRIFWASSNIIKVYDMNTFNLLGTITLPVTVYQLDAANDLLRIVRWGTDGLAFRDGRRIFIFRTPLAAP